MPAGRRSTSSPARRRGRRRPGRARADALRRLHRLQGGRPAHRREGGRASQPGQRWIKRVVAEMGGKDAIVVDEDADLDAAVAQVVAVGLRLPGPEVLGLLARDRRTGGLRAVRGRRSSHGRRSSRSGPDARPDELHGPGGRRARSSRRSWSTSRSARSEGEARSPAADRGTARGYFVAARRSSPTWRRRPASRRRRSSAPCSAITEARDFDDALAIANDTEYGLTGAVFGRDRAADRERAGAVPRRQPLPQPQVHRRAGRRPPLRRLQHERHRHQGRRPRLPAALPAGQGDHREAVGKPGHPRRPLRP